MNSEISRQNFNGCLLVYEQGTSRSYEMGWGGGLWEVEAVGGGRRGDLLLVMNKNSLMKKNLQ